MQLEHPVRALRSEELTTDPQGPKTRRGKVFSKASFYKLLMHVANAGKFRNKDEYYKEQP